MAESRVKLSKKDRLAVAWRSTFLQGSWNYERMQNGGWCFSMCHSSQKSLSEAISNPAHMEVPTLTKCR